MDKITQLKQLIKNNPDFVFLSGAGVSTASGIPDFRSKNGLYAKFKNAEYLLSIDALLKDTNQFYSFYKNQILIDGIRPNLIHSKLAEWERSNKMGWVITQNIDGLHKLAGSSHVVELHGTTNRHYCMKCGKEYTVQFVKTSNGVPYCSCGGIIRPDVVLYGESLHDGDFETCIRALNNTNLLIVAGTTLAVSTAVGIFNMYRGKYLVILNNESTLYDNNANIVIHDDLIKIFNQL